MLKRVITLLFCLIIVFVAIFGFVVGVVSVPTIYSYAEINVSNLYEPLRDSSDAVKAFQAYCKSRDLTIEGSITDAVTTFTTGAYNSCCNAVGVNVSQLQAEIKAEYDQSGKPVKFLFTNTGVMAMNRVFAQFLQDNEIEVGDEVNDQTVYDGYYANGSNVFVIKSGTSAVVDPSNLYLGSDLSAKGSTYFGNGTTGVVGHFSQLLVDGTVYSNDITLSELNNGW